MRWKIHSERTLYEDRWVHLLAADVELPDGRHLDRLIRASPGAGAVVVLLIWRHRFITNSWTYEIPVGSIDGDEEPAIAAAREVEEETGWRPGPLRPLVYVQPTPGLMTSEHHIFRADSAEYIAPPVDGFESERVDWVGRGHQAADRQARHRNRNDDGRPAVSARRARHTLAAVVMDRCQACDRPFAANRPRHGTWRQFCGDDATSRTRVTSTPRHASRTDRDRRTRSRRPRQRPASRHRNRK
jgi:8-oxo-dGTP pyrophosphatase MutT (NUDIX family)